MAKFMLLLHEDPSGFAELSPQDMQTVIAEYTAWRDQLINQNQFVGGEKLVDEGGKHLNLDQNQVRITDGPYSEAKEVLGGFFIIDAADYDQACDISAQCPHLKYNGRIELRQVDEIH